MVSLNSKCGEHDTGMTRMPKSDVDSHFELLQDYRDLVAGVNVLREAIELAFDVTLPSAPTTKEEFAIIARAIYNAADRQRQASTAATEDDRTTRTYFSYRIDVWTTDGESIVEHLAGLENLIVARAAYRAACKRWPKAVITLRQGARVVEGSRHWPT